ncbi:MAG: DNA starvation/stationary phase protection protein Dps [Anaerolineae bacterium]|nr:DNA starvation/stationary phase protection protein Dps [Anaerolineae bacterium]
MQADHTTRTDAANETGDAMMTLLNQHLADTFDLYSEVKQAHWNVKGMHFMQLHLLFDDLAQTLLEYVDSIAERLTALGGVAMGTTRMVAAQSQLPEFPSDIVRDQAVVELLVQRYESYGSTIHEAINMAAGYDDAESADLFTQIAATIAKQRWFLAAHLHE